MPPNYTNNYKTAMIDQNPKTAENTISRNATGSAYWALAQQLSNQVIHFAGVAVLARILSPDDFGVFGMAILLVNLLQMFTEMGLSEALVQRQELSKEDMDTAWAAQLIRCVLSGALLMIFAPLVAGFFEESRATDLVRALGVVVILTGFTNLLQLLSRDLHFKKIFWILVLGSTANSASAIVYGLIHPNSWALIVGYGAEAITVIILSYVYNSYRPVFHITWTSFRSLFRFGKWILTTTMLQFILNRADNIMAGKLFGAASLGLYQIAFRISEVTTSHFSRVVFRVLYPAYSKLQDRTESLHKGYLVSLSLTTSIGGCVAFSVMLFPEFFIRLLVGDKWLEAAQLVSVLCVWAYIRCIISVSEPLFRAMGLPRLETQANVLRTILFAVLIPILAFRYRLLGIACVPALAGLVSLPYYFVCLRRILVLPATSFLKPILLPIISAFCGGASIYYLGGFHTGANFLLGSVKVTQFLMVYTGVILFLDYLCPGSELLTGLAMMLKRILSRKKSNQAGLAAVDVNNGFT
jgi:lipopolysaccharide exporter